MPLRHRPATIEGTVRRSFIDYLEPGSIFSTLSLLAIAGALLSLSWKRWSTPFFDVGRELYTAWSISQGARLYHDIWLPRGPLSSHWNGLVFDLFGASMSTLALTNLLILAFAVLLLHRAIQREYGRVTALLASFVWLTVFAFARYGEHGNYNFILPYAHEVTHGLALSLVVLVLLLRALGSGDEPGSAASEHRARGSLLAAGFALGLVALTKQEIAVGATVATLATVASETTLPWRRRLEQLAVIALGVAIPLGICLLLLGSTPFAMTWNLSIGSVVRENLFYQVSLGLDRPAEHLGRIGLAAFVLAGELLVIAGIGRWLVAARPWRIALATALFVALQLALFAFGPLPAERVWAQAPAFLPLLAGAIALSCLVTRLSSPEHGMARAFLCWLAIFASFMLLKLGLRPRVVHYGFSQALPAAMLFVVVCFGLLPGWLSRFRVDPRLVRSAVASLIVVFCLYSVYLEQLEYRKLDAATGENGDLFYRPHSEEAYRDVIALLDRHVKPGDTLAVLPEGVLFNYLLRIENPTPHISFLPFEFMLTGEERIVEDFRASPPDLVLLLPRNVEEYGFREFGQRGYGDRVMTWLGQSYRRLEGAGARQPTLFRQRRRGRTDAPPGRGDRTRSEPLLLYNPPILQSLCREALSAR